MAWSWSISSGTLPPDLSLDASGLITGVPKTNASTTIYLDAVDGTNAYRNLYMVLNTGYNAGLVGFWPLTYVYTDSSGNRRTLSSNGIGGGFSTGGVGGGGVCWFTSGTTYLTDTSIGSVPVNTGSVGVWFKTTAPGSGLRGIIAKLYEYGIYLTDSVIGFYDLSTFTFTSSGVNVADGLWHFAFLTFNSGVSNGTNLYLDGNKTPILTGTTTVLTHSGTYIGSGVGRGSVFNGYVDEPRVYNRIVSLTEMKQIYDDFTPYA